MRRRGLVLLAVAALVLAVAAGVAVRALDTDDAGRRPGEPAPDARAKVRYEPTGTRLADCGARDEGCRRRAFGDLAYDDGPEAALAKLRRVYGDDGDMACHAAAHEIGRAALARFDGDIADTYDAGDATCFAGYYHGVFETSFRGVDRAPTRLGERASELCATRAATETGFHQYNCLHGVGHGLLFATGDIADSTHACRHVRGDARVRACYSGVMMEAITPTTDGPSAWSRSDDPEYPCSVVARDEKGPCYESSAARLVQRHGGRWAEAARDCDRIDPAYRTTCVYAMGTEAADSAHWHAGRTVALCRQLPADDQDTCLAGAASATIANYGDERRGVQLCEAAGTPPDHPCRRDVAAFVAVLAASRDEARARCRELLPGTPLEHCTHPLEVA